MQLLVILLLLLLLTSIQAQQNSCSCTCCNGQSCTPTSLPTIDIQSCTLESCLGQCRVRYQQCQGNFPNGYISAQCGSTNTPQFTCRCACCNTGSTTCSPYYVGDTVAYSCQTGACSIACITQYPTQCRADQNGVTQGTCSGYITTTTTTTTTTIGPWRGNICSCTCPSIGSCCSSTFVGITSASSCSSTVCIQACRNQYPSSCLSSPNNSQMNGTCISDVSGNTACGCRCCGTNGCINYQINTNGGCTTCDSICRQYAPCTNANQVTTQTCTTNNTKTTHPWMIFIFITSISTFFV